MTSFEPGQLVLVRFPFTDLRAKKKRPALVVSPENFQLRHGDLVLLAVTSRAQPEDSLCIRDWQSAGLPKPSWVKPTIGTFAAELIVKSVGSLTAQDFAAVRAALDLAIARDFSALAA